MDVVDKISFFPADRKDDSTNFYNSILKNSGVILYYGEEKNYLIPLKCNFCWALVELKCAFIIQGVFFTGTPLKVWKT